MTFQTPTASRNLPGRRCTGSMALGNWRSRLTCPHLIPHALLNPYGTPADLIHNTTAVHWGFAHLRTTQIRHRVHRASGPRSRLCFLQPANQHQGQRIYTPRPLQHLIQLSSGSLARRPEDSQVVPSAQGRMKRTIIPSRRLPGETSSGSTTSPKGRTLLRIQVQLSRSTAGIRRS